MAEMENPHLENQLDEAVAIYLRAAAPDRPQLRQQLLVNHPALANDLQAFFDTQDQFQELALPLRVAFSALAGLAFAVIGM